MPRGSRGRIPRANEMIPAVFRNALPGCRELTILLVFLTLAVGAAVRAEVPLYETEVVWSDQDADRANAFRQALRQVIVKVTGLRGFPDSAQIGSLVENAQGLVQQYQLRVVEAGLGGTSVQEPRLWAQFDQAAVDRLVREAGLPVWGKTRPQVLAWVVVENKGSLQVVGSDGTEEAAWILRHGAASRGVPLFLPLLDLEDQTLAGPPELWVEAGFRIREASERYQPGSILIGRIRQGVLWEAQWSLLLPDGAQRWDAEGDVFELVVDEGVHEAIDSLAAHYMNTVTDTGGAAIVVSVSGVHDFMGYARTMRYLEALNEVESVDVLAVVSGRLRLGLTLRTGVTGLRELVGLGSTLAEDIGDVDGALALRLLP